MLATVILHAQSQAALTIAGAWILEPSEHPGLTQTIDDQPIAGSEVPGVAPGTGATDGAGRKPGAIPAPGSQPNAGIDPVGTLLNSLAAKTSAKPHYRRSPTPPNANT